MCRNVQLKIGLFVLRLITFVGTPLYAADLTVDPRIPRPVSVTIDGYPVYTYGDMSVYAVSPTYDESVVLQQDNSNPWKKIMPQKSWEIKNNLIGLTPTRSPSSYADEIEPFHPNFFVDNNPASVGYAGRPVGDPSITRAWVRIDLPRQMKIKAVAFAGNPPANFEIRVFDWYVWQRSPGGNASVEQNKWQTVYKVEGNEAQSLPRPDNTAPNVYVSEKTKSISGTEITQYRFDSVEAREIWITSPDDFTLGSIEIYDEHGDNVALLSKGCGVTVSANRHLFWLDQHTQASLWQMQYDMGIKWLRLSYYLTPFIWTFVEKEKGIYKIDPYLDRLVTEASQNGIEVTLTLGPPDNNLYKTEEERVTGFCNYTQFMVNHFRGRITYYEILNEFYNQDTYGPGKQGPVENEADRYITTALPAAKVIRQTDPQAKICLCGPCPLVADFILTVLKKGMAEYVDVITWHPYSFPLDTDDDYAPEELDRPRHLWAPEDMTTYAQAVTYLRQATSKLGFHGKLWANESGAYTIHRDRTSNLIGAKYMARSFLLHTSLDVPVFWNETTSLMRPSWQLFWKPDAPDLACAQSYYMMRTLCTLLDSVRPVKMEISTDPTPEKIEVHSFEMPNNKKLMALWIAEKSRKNGYDDYAGQKLNLAVTIDNPLQKIIGIDLLNGREQEMTVSAEKGRVLIANLIIKDYPVLLRFE